MTLEPRWWSEQPGALLDGPELLVVLPCDGCNRHRHDAVRVVFDHDDALPGAFVCLCTRCLVNDHRWARRRVAA